MKRLLAAAAGLLALTGAASAQTGGFVTTNVNLRAGPSTEYPAVAVLLAGSPLNIFGCLDSYSWCDVDWRGYRGWVAAQYLEYDYRGRRVVLPDYAPTIGVPIIGFSVDNYWGRYYRDQPWYGDRYRWGPPPPAPGGWYGPPPQPGWNNGPPPQPRWNNGPPPPRWNNGPPPPRWNDGPPPPRWNSGPPPGNWNGGPPSGNWNGGPPPGQGRPPQQGAPSGPPPQNAGPPPQNAGPPPQNAGPPPQQRPMPPAQPGGRTIGGDGCSPQNMQKGDC